MSTAARVLTLNCRNENAMELFPSRRWNRRRPYLIEFIKECAPSVLGVQECTNNMAAEITEVWDQTGPSGDRAQPRSYGTPPSG